MMRTVKLSRQPEQFFEAYEAALRVKGYPDATIQVLAAVLLDMYRGLMAVGRLRGNPEFQGPDPVRSGFSRYVFVDSVVAGYYSASPDVVVLEYLTFTFGKDVDAEEIIGHRDAEAHRAA